MSTLIGKVRNKAEAKILYLRSGNKEQKKDGSPKEED